MKYYEYDIDYDPKNGSQGVVAVKEKMDDRELLRHLQDKGEVEQFEPRDFECSEITKKEYEKEMNQ